MCTKFHTVPTSPRADCASLTERYPIIVGMTMNPENYYSKKTTDVANTYFNKQAKVDIIATGFLAMNFAVLVVTDVDTLEKVMRMVYNNCQQKDFTYFTN